MKILFYHLVQYEKHVKDIRQRNMDIEKMITKINENLTQREKKDCMIENLIAVTSESISDHFEKVNKIFW